MQTDPTPSGAPPLKVRIEASEIAMVLLLLLSGVGIAVTDWEPEWGFDYWLWMAPVFGVTCLATGWSAARRQGQSPSRVVFSQILHWLGLAAALYDAMGKYLEIPAYKLMGPKVRDRVAVAAWTRPSPRRPLPSSTTTSRSGPSWSIARVSWLLPTTTAGNNAGTPPPTPRCW